MLQLSVVIITLLVFGNGVSEDSGKGEYFGFRYDLEFLKKITERKVIGNHGIRSWMEVKISTAAGRTTKKGFGKLNSEFWLGLDNIHALVSDGKWELMINMKDDGKGDKYATYKTFYIGPERGSYVLTVGDYKGDAGDSLKLHNGMKFSTKDKDNDNWSSHCAVRYSGAWWYETCHHSNLNGVYGSGGTKGPRWKTFSGADLVEFVEMKIKQIV